MGNFISGGFIKPIMFYGNSNFISGSKGVSGINYVAFITSLGNNFITVDGENFLVKN